MKKTYISRKKINISESLTKKMKISEKKEDRKLG